ncbi:hypothetical protein LWI29_016052 [Acer saccharum]|uniref:Uncharacterized protein n=1 Tax=Acer saccharum TaxID=4024 RepID=A0AA39VVR5_ACESA|nr:hypothetical protein LWI29_016052 [Acer saccharum]
MNDPKDSSSTNPTSGTQGSKDPLSAQGPNDPFFVHHSDNPTTVLVSPRLSGDNYNTGSLTGIAPQANLTVASLDNEMSPDAPPVSDSSPVPTSAQPDPPLRSVQSRQPPTYLKHYHCPTLPHVTNLAQSDSKGRFAVAKLWGGIGRVQEVWEVRALESEKGVFFAKGY